MHFLIITSVPHRRNVGCVHSFVTRYREEPKPEDGVPKTPRGRKVRRLACWTVCDVSSEAAFTAAVTASSK
jgi:hypothetical protein